MKLKRKNIAILSLFVIGGMIFFMTIYLHSQKETNEISSRWNVNNYSINKNVLYENSENKCGLIALKMIFDYYKIPSTLIEIESKVVSNEKGTSMYALKQMAEIKGLHAEGWRFTLEGLIKTSFPVILFVKGNHYVVADSILDDTLFLRDPTLGRFVLPLSELTKIWKGETLIFKQIN
jgi:ABC-type bacteriocin/lantibiotic exporter with double-glycine peptidase domain